MLRITIALFVASLAAAFLWTEALPVLSPLFIGVLLMGMLRRPPNSLAGRIRDAIANDRCDGESDWASGVNAACARHLEITDNLIRGEK